jgi:hypothetical protein
MATEPVPGGYLDRQALARALQANAAVRRIVGELLQGGSQQRQLQLLLQLTYEMGEQNHALHEMRRIRQRVAGGEPPGDDEARNANT